jgi:phage replication-related protein YjqB (UPF0714/DUF867 family)
MRSDGPALNGDTYTSMVELLTHLPSAGHYEIQCHDGRRSGLKLFAPHGGCIEPCTGGLVVELAGDEFDYYVFRGMMKENCFRNLHVSSTRYDEPTCRRMAGEALLAIAVHGCSSEREFIEIGGGNGELSALLQTRLQQQGLPAVHATGRRSGEDPKNFINCARYQGVQIELSAGFRRTLFPEFPSMRQRHPANVRLFLDAVRPWLRSMELTLA